MTATVVTLVGLVAVGLAVGFRIASLSRPARSAPRPGRSRRAPRSDPREVHTITEFAAPVSPGELCTEIIASVDALPSAPAAGGLYLVRRSGHSLRYAYGDRNTTSFECRILLHTSREGCTGTVEVLSWTLLKGLLEHRHELQRVRARVEIAVAESGGITRRTDRG